MAAEIDGRVLALQVTTAAILTASYPPETPFSTPRLSDIYCFVLNGQDKPLQEQCFTSANYTMPLFSSLPPDTWFNVSVIVNELPLQELTRPFMSGEANVHTFFYEEKIG